MRSFAEDDSCLQQIWALCSEMSLNRQLSVTGAGLGFILWQVEDLVTGITLKIIGLQEHVSGHELLHQQSHNWLSTMVHLMHVDHQVRGIELSSTKDAVVP